MAVWWKLTGEISVADTSGSDCWDRYHFREGEVHESSSNTGICINNGVRWGGAFRHIECYLTSTSLCSWWLLCLERNLIFCCCWCWFLHVSYCFLKMQSCGAVCSVQYEDHQSINWKHRWCCVSTIVADNTWWPDPPNRPVVQRRSASYCPISISILAKKRGNVANFRLLNIHHKSRHKPSNNTTSKSTSLRRVFKKLPRYEKQTAWKGFHNGCQSFSKILFPLSSDFLWGVKN